jgi:hypothetical protein
MEDSLTRRAKQVVAALAQSASTEWKPGMVVHAVTSNGASSIINPSLGFTEEALQNEALTIISAIGPLKDYVNAYCKVIGVPKSGDDVLAASRDAALVHDLWNVDKHLELNRPARSGITPKLRHIQKWMSLSVSNEGESAYISQNLESGDVSVQGNVTFILDAMIFGEDEIFVANFRETCERAIEAWLTEIKRLGLEIPAP